MRILYLDQNKWIECARVWHGKDKDPELLGVVEQLRHLVDVGALIMPLSHVHFTETARRPSSGSRERLALVMWSLSLGRTIAGYPEITRYEVREALSRRFSKIQSGSWKLLGRGWHHAFGQPDPPSSKSTEHLAEMMEVDQDIARQFLSDMIGGHLLAGTNPDGGGVPAYRNDQWAGNFANHLRDFPQKLATLPREKWDDALLAASILDIEVPLGEVLLENRIAPEALGALGRKGLTELLFEMPTRRADFHLHRQFLKNPLLQPKLTDLNDWAGLVPAVMYCDVVVCEKHFQDLITRGGFQPRAAVLKDLRQLSSVFGEGDKGSL